MIRPLKAISFLLVLAMQFPAASAASAKQPSELLTAAQLQEDLAFLRKSIASTHPDVSFSADERKLEQAYAKVERQFRKPMTRDQAWRVFAELNPVYSDAHLFVSMGDFDKEMQAHLDAGGGFFPFDVQVSHAGDVFITGEAGGASSPLAGARIEKINGVPARSIVRSLLAYAHGDTAALRANVLSGRWWRFFWRAFGTPSTFKLSVATPAGLKSLSLPASRALPTAIAKETDFAHTYRFEMLPNKVALLTVGSFLWPDKKLFYALTEDAFKKMRDAGATSLIIDVRANTGGDDDMWKLGILPYLADKPYRHGSTYIKKVIAGRESATEKLGVVVSGEIKTWEQPQPDNPLRFTGKTYVLAGRMTYSSAVLFVNTMQDFKFATLVGEAGVARARQSGGIQSMTLPNSKWGVVAPRFILDRPSGSREPELVQPDLVMPDDPFDERALIDALHTRIVKGR